MEDVVSITEAIRLLHSRTGTANRLARWENVYRMWEAGKSLLEIGKWIGTSESTARQLLKRAALERQKQPGFVWPVKDGKKVCDIPHPMPAKEDPRAWYHVRSFEQSPRSRRAFCHVCKKGYPLGRPLTEVFDTGDKHEPYDPFTDTHTDYDFRREAEADRGDTEPPV